MEKSFYMELDLQNIVEEHINDSDIRTITDSFKKQNIKDNKVRILSRKGFFPTLMLVEAAESGKIMLVYSENTGVIVSNKQDECLITEGEMTIENVSWLQESQICVFYKHYLPRNTFSKVIIDFENQNSISVFENSIDYDDLLSIRKERWMEKYIKDHPEMCDHAFCIPEDW